MALGGIAAVLAGIVASITVFAIQASRAKHDARDGQSQALAGQAVASLGSDPLAGLRLAIRAAEASPTSDAESALRAALTADPLRDTLHGVPGPASIAVFSPDGKLVVTGSGDRTARIWDVASGRGIQTLKGHTDVVSSAAFSPDGTLVVTAGDDRTARIWDVASGRSTQTLRGHSARSAVFSPDGKLVATAGGDGTASIWDVPSGGSLRTLKGPGTSAVFSPDGKLVVTAHFDGAVVWVVASGRRLHILGARQQRPFACTEPYNCPTSASAAFSPDGKLVVTDSDTDHPDLGRSQRPSGAHPRRQRGRHRRLRLERRRVQPGRQARRRTREGRVRLERRQWPPSANPHRAQ